MANVRKYATLEELENLKNSIEASQSKLLDVIERIDAKVSQVPTSHQNLSDKPQKVNRLTDQTNDEFSSFETDLPQQYEEILDKYFDQEDGFRAKLEFPKLNDNGAITFTIFVPDKFSNNTPAHKMMYKRDLRTVAIDPGKIIQGIDGWCAKVAKNIRYNKLIQTK